MNALLLVFGFALGSIPFGVLVARTQGVDIQKSNSGNIGATNVMRTLGWKLGLLVFVLDCLKGIIPAVIGMALTKDPTWAFFAGAAATLGHTFSPFVKFKGGKGIATTFGAVIGSAPLVALFAFSGFAIVLFVTRFMSVASIFAAFALVAGGFIFPQPLPVQVAFILLAILIIYRHKSNIQRLIQKTEPKFEFKSRTKPTSQASEIREEISES